MSSAPQYSLSYTAGAALIREAVEVARLKNDLNSWPEVKKHVLDNNTFQSRTVSTLKRMYGEVSRRLKHLTDDEIRLLAHGTEPEQKLLVWLAICKHYLLIRDFAQEVLVHQYKAARYPVNHDDYDAFFNAKAEWDDNIDGASSTTKSKARQVLFKMLRECGLVNEHGEIVQQQIDPILLGLLKRSEEGLNIYPGMEH